MVKLKRFSCYFCDSLAFYLFKAFLFTLTVFPIMTSDDVDNVFTSHHSRDEKATNFKRRILKNTTFQKIAKKMLPVYDRKGLMEL